MDFERENVSSEEGRGYQEWYRELEKILNEHIGVLPGLDPKWMAHLLVFDAAHALPNVWKKKELHESLDKLDKSAVDMRSVMNSYFPLIIYDAIQFAGHEALHGAETASGREFTKEERIDFLSGNPERKLVDAINVITEGQEVMKRVIASVRKTIDEGVKVGRKDIEAWRLVHAAAKLCEVRYPGAISVPSYMNESGDFYRLLEKLFIHYGLDSSPVAAFKAWKTHVVSY